MKKENYGAPVERGAIDSIQDGKYRVASYTRSGIVSLPMPPVNEENTFSVGDKVYFFMFDDGNGMILGKI